MQLSFQLFSISFLQHLLSSHDRHYPQKKKQKKTPSVDSENKGSGAIVPQWRAGSKRGGFCAAPAVQRKLVCTRHIHLGGFLVRTHSYYLRVGRSERPSFSRREHLYNTYSGRREPETCIPLLLHVQKTSHRGRMRSRGGWNSSPRPGTACVSSPAVQFTRHVHADVNSIQTTLHLHHCLTPFFSQFFLESVWTGPRQCRST